MTSDMAYFVIGFRVRLVTVDGDGPEKAETNATSHVANLPSHVQENGPLGANFSACA